MKKLAMAAVLATGFLSVDSRRRRMAHAASQCATVHRLVTFRARSINPDMF